MAQVTLAEPIGATLLTVTAATHVLDVLKAFGPQIVADQRTITLNIDRMSTHYWFARVRIPPMKFAAADAVLRRLETDLANAIASWEKAVSLHPGLLRASIVSAPAEEPHSGKLGEIDFSSKATKALSATRRLRSENAYRDIYGQPPPEDRHKLLEHAMLWEPLFGLMNHFGVQQLSEYQPITRTVKALHLAIGIDPPNTNAFKQALRAWRKRAR